jgi:di/tricarboxylate transporter
MAVRLQRPPSQLLMPLVFAAHAGSMLTLTGSPVNVLISDASMDAGLGPFTYFEFAAAAAAFLTPVATPTNLMVMGPGGYQFGDYWKLGLPLMIWFFLVATFLIPLIWPF